MPHDMRNGTLRGKTKREVGDTTTDFSPFESILTTV